MQKYLDMYIKYANWIVIPLIIGLIFWHEPIFVYAGSVILGVYCGIYGIGAFAKENDSRYWKLYVLVCNSLIFYSLFTLLLIPFFLPISSSIIARDSTFYIHILKYVNMLFQTYLSYKMDRQIAIIIYIFCCLSFFQFLYVFALVKRIFMFLILFFSTFAALVWMGIDKIVIIPISGFFMVYFIVYLIFIIKQCLFKFNNIVLCFLVYVFIGSWFWVVVLTRIVGFIFLPLTGFSGHF